MNHTGRIKSLFIIALIGILVSFASYSPTNANEAQQGVKSMEISQPIASPSSSFDDFKKKPYYKTIFDAKAQDELETAEANIIKGDKYYEKAFGYYKEINSLMKIIQATKSDRVKSKSQRKIKRLEKRMNKYLDKAFKYYDKGHNVKTKIYKENLPKVRATSPIGVDRTTAGNKVESIAVSHFARAANYITLSKNAKGIDKFNKLRSAHNERLQGYSNQELAFGFYSNDTTLETKPYVPRTKEPKDLGDTIVVNKGDTIVVKETDVKITEKYNPYNDPNLYRSQGHLIIPRLKMTTDDYTALNDVNKKADQANNMMKQIDLSYDKIDELNVRIAKEKDNIARERLKIQAEELEQKAFYKLITASNMYVDINKAKYALYNKHLDQVRLTDTSALTVKAGELEKEAIQFYQLSESERMLAQKQMFKSDQYIGLMNTIDMQLLALQVQESALGIYLDIPELKNTDNVDLVTRIYEEGQKNDSAKNNQTDSVVASTKLKWNVASTYTYSESQPKPKLEKATSGTRFKVQFGILKGLLPLTKFVGLTPLSYDTFTNNPYRRFYAGNYQTYEAAEHAKTKLKAKGYKGAYVVAYRNGKRVSYASAKAKVTKNNAYNQQKAIELARINGQTPPTNNNGGTETNEIRIVEDNTGYVKENSIKKTRGLVYAVQLGMFATPKKYSDLKNMSPVFTEKLAGRGTRYMVGAYNKYSKAKVAQKEAVRAGFADAYVVAYNNGVLLSLDDARKLSGEVRSSNTQGGNTQVVVHKPVFMVQVAAYKQAQAISQIRIDTKVPADRQIAVQKYNGMNYYTIGSYKTYAEAKYLQKVLAGKSVDGFVVAFVNGKKVNLQNAIKMQK